ncbi:L-glyceraldehyde 3-phosphate reductase [Vallitalea okinawensis]|uniref:L-glyceraldehyde 3-phosphate reductase n=1 Tax=Vallitalea okinawensis TaxID=2078660 RepID=UPI000CFD0311|nr:L-glyceraldehyde 3-phosphate reductase [Vallitalea okinawensis]
MEIQRYVADPNRYENMIYRRCGRSGLKLPLLSLGLWHNFGDVTVYHNSRLMIRRAFDLGITHFDLANNYGPPPGSAEENFGKILADDMKPYRDEMIISTKAGYHMWQGPYGDWGSKKYLVSSLDQSLRRMGLDYVDIFYHHRPDLDTPLEETMGALDQIVKQGKALYVGISNYGAKEARKAINILKGLGTPCLIHQPRYSMFDRWIEDELIDVLGEEGVGGIVFSPLAQGLLTNRYLKGIPADSRAGAKGIFLRPEHLTDEVMSKISKLNEIALERQQSLAQMALAWVLRDERITSALVGASRVEQLEDNVKIVQNLAFTADELSVIEDVLQG